MVINQLLKIFTFHFHHQVWYIESDFPQRNRSSKPPGASAVRKARQARCVVVGCAGAAPVGVFVALEPWDVNDKMEKPPTSVLWISWKQDPLKYSQGGSEIRLKKKHLWDGAKTL